MKHALRRIAACTSMVVVVGAMSVPFMTGGASAAATASPRASASLFRVKMARNFLAHLKIGQPRQAGEVHSASTNPSVDSVTSVDSVNWSGYTDTPGTSTYSAVSGSWTQPTAKCPASGIAMAAFWVGLDGFSSSDPTVEQDGTIIECIEGLPLYADWWELYPSNDVQIENEVKPGDSIAASVLVSGTSYTLTVTDSTHPKDSFTTAQTCASTTCFDTSAEWIAEAPCCKNLAGTLVYNLADFKTWTLTDAADTYDGTAGNIDSGPTVNEITMVSQKKNADTKALPGALTAGGTSFTDTWKKAS